MQISGSQENTSDYDDFVVGSGHADLLGKCYLSFETIIPVNELFLLRRGLRYCVRYQLE